MSIKSRSRLKEQDEPKKRRKPICRHDDWKPTELEDGFILSIHYNELQDGHCPLFTKPQEGLITTKGKFKDGDYSVQGFEDKFVIERKRIGDFVSYITSEYATKTIKKLERMSKMDWAGLVVEEDENELYEPYLFSGITKEQVRNQIVSMQTHYRIHTYFNSDVVACERWVLDCLSRCYRYARR